MATTRRLLERAFSMGALRLPAADRDCRIDGLASRNASGDRGGRGHPRGAPSPGRVLGRARQLGDAPHRARGGVSAPASTRHWPSYSSWRRHQMPASLRPRGARSSHWYMPQRTSSPRA
jgi:hypothetical protein